MTHIAWLRSIVSFTLGFHISRVFMDLFWGVNCVADVLVSFAIGLEMCVFTYFMSHTCNDSRLFFKHSNSLTLFQNQLLSTREFVLSTKISVSLRFTHLHLWCFGFWMMKRSLFCMSQYLSDSSKNVSMNKIYFFRIYKPTFHITCGYALSGPLTVAYSSQ